MEVSHCVVDNTGNNATVSVNYGPFRYSVSPFTRKTFPVLKAQWLMQFQLTLNTVPITFVDFDPGLPDDTNQVATGASATAGTAPGGGGTGGGVALDPLKTDALVTLSNGNLTASASMLANAVYTNTMSVATATLGKFYAEYTLTQGALADNYYFGVINESALVKKTGGLMYPGFYGGDVANGSNAFVILGTGQFCCDGGLDSTTPYSNGNVLAGDVVCHAIDLTAKKSWVKKAGGTWNNSGTADPATGVGGKPYVTLGSGNIRPMVGICSNSGPGTETVKWTANFGGLPYANAAPTGFGNWV